MATVPIIDNAGVVAVPWVSSLPPEVWSMIGQQIQSQKTRDDLARVCRAFRGLFLPLARETLLVKLHEYDMDVLEKMLPPSGIENTKVLDIRLMEFCTGPNRRHRDNFWPKSWNTAMANFITRLIGSMPNLRDFRYSDQALESHDSNADHPHRFYDGALESDEGPSKILQDPELIRSLKQHPRLTMIHFDLDHLLIDDPIPDAVSVKFEGFRNLTSLEVYKFQGPDTNFIDDLARTFGNCPRLTKLGLGKAVNADIYGDDNVMILDDDPGLLEKLCVKYSELAARDISPLPIRTLRLGVNFTPYKSASESSENYLAKLIKLEGIRNLHVWNGRYKTPTEDDDEEPTKIHWPLFDACRAVRNFQITLLTHEVLNWLNDKQWIEELILTEHYDYQNEAFRNISQLRLPRLSMLLLRDNVHASNAHPPLDDCETVEEDEWSESDDSEDAVFARSLLDSGKKLVQLSAAYGPPEPKSSQASEYQTPVKGICNNKFNSKPLFDCQQFTSILDRIPHNLQYLTKLGISIHFETQFWRFSHRLLYMPKLTHLRLEARCLGQYPPKTASCWPDISKPKEIALQYVKIMKNICPSLQYVNIGEYLWQMTPRWDIEMSCWEGIDFVEIDEDEKLKIELFAFERFVQQSGLLGADQPREWPEDEDRYFKDGPACINPWGHFLDFLDEDSESEPNFDSEGNGWSGSDDEEHDEEEYDEEEYDEEEYEEEEYDEEEYDEEEHDEDQGDNDDEN